MRTDHEGCPLRKNVQLVWPIIRRDNTTSTCFSLCTGTYHYPTVGLKRLYIFLSTSLLSYIPLTDSSWSNNHLWNTDVWCNHNICRFSHFFSAPLFPLMHAQPWILCTSKSTPASKYLWRIHLIFWTQEIFFTLIFQCF